jgi:hypothetical protein
VPDAAGSKPSSPARTARADRDHAKPRTPGSGTTPTCRAQRSTTTVVCSRFAAWASSYSGSLQDLHRPHRRLPPSDPLRAPALDAGMEAMPRFGGGWPQPQADTTESKARWLLWAS